MTVGAGLTGLAGLGSLGAGLYSLFGGGAQAPQQFNLPGQGTAAQGALGGIGGLGQYNLYGQNLGTAQQLTGNLINNPYASSYQQGANTAGGLGQLQALGQYGQGQNLQGASNQVLNTAFDPQQQLYGQQLALTQAQQNAANAGAGVGTTPYGAGLQDQNLQNFNIAWQNAQLGRQTQGLQAAGQGTTIAQGLESSAPGQYLQSSAIPYGTYGQIGQGQIGALNQLGQFGTSAQNQAQQPIQDYLSYLQAGTSQQGVNNQTAALQNQIQQQGINSVFSGLGGLGTSYNFSGYPTNLSPGMAMTNAAGNTTWNIA